jgi:hypothetical protein
MSAVFPLLLGFIEFKRNCGPNGVGGSTDAAGSLVHVDRNCNRHLM